MQGARVLTLVWWPGDRARRPPRGSCVARGAGEAMGLNLPPQVRYLLAWRHDLLHGGGRRSPPRRPAPSAVVGADAGPGGRPERRGHRGAAVRRSVESQRPLSQRSCWPVRGCGGRLRFHRAPTPTAADVADVLAAIVPGVRARLERKGLADDGADGDHFADAAPLLAGLAAASVAGTLAVEAYPGGGPAAGGAGEGRGRASELMRRTRAGRVSICMPGWRGGSPRAARAHLPMCSAPDGDR